MKPHLLLLITIFLSVIACGQRKQDAASDSKEIRLLSEEVCSYLVKDVIDTEVLTFTGNVPVELLPAKGERFTLPIAEKSPFGFAGEALKIERTQDGCVIVHTRLLSLQEIMEAYNQSRIDVSSTTKPEVVGVFDAAGNPVEYEIIQK